MRNHHERWDGRGYPDGMAGADIPLPGRIVAIADAYDAMATDRPYKRGLPLEDCEALLRKNAGTMYDPDLVDLFCRLHLGALYRDDYAGGDAYDGDGGAVETSDGVPEADPEAELAERQHSAAVTVEPSPAAPAAGRADLAK